MGVAFAYALLLLIFVLSQRFLGERDFEVLVTVVQIAIPVPAAVFAFAFQRRSAFLAATRNVWPTVVDAVQSAIHVVGGSAEASRETVSLKLSIAIDTVRCLYTNVEGPGKKGWLYPFEGLKEIYQLVASGEEYSAADRDKLFQLWREVREKMLDEMERIPPESLHGPFFNKAS